MSAAPLQKVEIDGDHDDAIGSVDAPPNGYFMRNLSGSGAADADAGIIGQLVDQVLLRADDAHASSTQRAEF
jgi:hypothetical protein